MSLLSIDHLTKRFGGLTAVSDVSLDINQQEIVGLIGPNGAGKSTLFNLITGVYVPTEGSIDMQVDHQEVSLIGRSADKINDLGLARTFQNIRLFKDMTVKENILIAMDNKQGTSLMHSILRTQTYYDNRDKLHHKADQLLEHFGLADEANNKAKNLAYGQQRRLEIVRALATEPKIIFLDEPAAGMNPNETQELLDLIRMIRDEFKVTVVLIEHDMSLVMKVCERIYVLEYGRLIAEGSPHEIQNNQAVINAYLGGA
ncbi:ABC transporter ATP-binding protein [Aerococcus urinaehominis]|uniref:ABC transporter ATP-binding protein n=1 Tax=Aerococcus urinaehominis TaxID=128944 RepID=A0A0X8FLD5_9LACT|nr:ABC transporter ATP-binding protein [Aerococcus urinaehominis]AMB99451.1 ABC transporter ATP-binding protein [Aerococcus urinaehominis]SDM28536.1 branched-chain amino acid transport system ATP-binding protein [Aerococcus urinaehominis]